MSGEVRNANFRQDRRVGSTCCSKAIAAAGRYCSELKARPGSRSEATRDRGPARTRAAARSHGDWSPAVRSSAATISLVGRKVARVRAIVPTTRARGSKRPARQRRVEVLGSGRRAVRPATASPWLRTSSAHREVAEISSGMGATKKRPPALAPTKISTRGSRQPVLQAVIEYPVVVKADVPRAQSKRS